MRATAVPQRSRLDAHQRRTLIVEAAIRLFAEKGFRGTTTRQLAAAAGVSEAILYHHFPSKRELYDAILERIVHSQETQPDPVLQRACEQKDDESFFTRLAQLALECHRQNPAVFRLVLFAALEGHELARLYYERQVLRYYDMVRRYVEQRQAEGAFRPMDPRLVVGIFTGMIGHLVFHKVMFGVDLLSGLGDQELAMLARVFLEGVRNKDRRCHEGKKSKEKRLA